MFQFKIDHIICTKDKLKKANLTSDDLCYLCKKERHTVEHMLVRCSHTVKFWKNGVSWLKKSRWLISKQKKFTKNSEWIK